MALSDREIPDTFSGNGPRMRVMEQPYLPMTYQFPQPAGANSGCSLCIILGTDDKTAGVLNYRLVEPQPISPLLLQDAGLVFGPKWSTCYGLYYAAIQRLQNVNKIINNVSYCFQTTEIMCRFCVFIDWSTMHLCLCVYMIACNKERISITTN